LTDFLSRFSDDSLPSSLAFITVPTSLNYIETAKELCEIWRNRADLKKTYIDAAKVVEQESGLDAVDCFDGPSYKTLPRYF